MGKDSPIWVDRQDLDIEDYIEKVNVDDVTIGVEIITEINSSNISEDLDLIVDEELSSGNIEITG